MHRSRHTRVTVLLAVSALLVTACGTRVDRDRIEAVGNGYAAAATDGLPAGATLDGAVAPGPAEAGLGSATDPASAGDVGAGSAASGASSADTSAAGGGSTAPGQAGGGAAAPSGGAAAPSGGGASTTQTAQGGPKRCEKQLKPVVLGQTLAASGLAGASIGNIRTGMAAWAKDVNARGGVECHPVRLVQLDDGSDPARVQSNWNELKSQGMVAMVGAGVPVAIAALRSSAERDKIPVVGGDLTATDWVRSPFLFPQGGAPLAAYDGAVIEGVRASGGAKKAGLVYCVEASICTAIKNNYSNAAKKAGAQLGPVKAASLTQSDYTAECQEQKEAGTTVLFLALDGSATSRALRSCAQIGYRPTVATAAIAVSAQVSQDPNFRRDSWLGTPVLPFTETTATPGGREFAAAMKRYAAGVPSDGPMMFGWSSGKLFEAALAKVSDKARRGDVTTAMVLEGLYALKDEKVGGLSPGVSYAPGAPARVSQCYFMLHITADGFGSPLGSQPKC